MPSLRKKPDGRYYIDFVTPQGQRKREMVRRPLDALGKRWEPVRDANVADLIYQDWLTHEWPRIDGPAHVQVDTTTLQGLVSWYTGVYLVGRVKGPSLRSFTYDLTHWTAFCAQHGLRTVEHVTSAEIEAYRAFLVPRLASTTLKRTMGTLRRLFNAAEAVGLVSLPKLTWPQCKGVRGPVVVLTMGQIARFLEVVQERRPWAYNAFCWQALTGLRPSDVCGFRWEHVEQDMAHIPQEKTGSLVHIPLTPKLRAILAEQRLRRRMSPWVFQGKRGGQLTGTTLRSIIADLAPVAGLPSGTSPKAFRHGLATFLAQQRVAWNVISERLGHQDPRTTFTMYQHAGIEDHQAIGQMAEDAVLGNQGTTQGTSKAPANAKP